MTAPLRGLVVRQPWATLAVEGIKTILDLPRRPKVERGETIAIVASDEEPETSQWEDGPYDDIEDRFQYGRDDVGTLGWWLADLSGSDAIHDLPLGAVVGLVTVDDALPIYHKDTVGRLDADQPFIADTSRFTPGAGWLGGPRVVTVRSDDGGVTARVDCSLAEREWPLGDFTPSTGRSPPSELSWRAAPGWSPVLPLASALAPRTRSPSSPTTSLTCAGARASRPSGRSSSLGIRRSVPRNSTGPCPDPKIRVRMLPWHSRRTCV